MADAANQLIAELIGEAFIDAIKKSQHRAANRLRDAWTWLRRVAGAPPHVELVSPDGALYTGLVVVDRSRAVVLIALRHADTRRYPLDPQFGMPGADYRAFEFDMDE